jgi:hypothetical protein
MTSTTRTVTDRAEGIGRMIRSLARHTEEWDPSDLHKLRHLEDDIAEVRAKVITGLRDSGSTDTEIGEALGITRAAVSKRWPGGGRYVGAAGRYRTSEPTVCRPGKQ